MLKLQTTSHEHLSVKTGSQPDITPTFVLDICLSGAEKYPRIRIVTAANAGWKRVLQWLPQVEMDLIFG